jgi:hypothetical protein
MKTFPTSASDDEIRAAIADWSEHLAQRRFADALEMFEPIDPMTPAELEEWISNYGASDPFPDGRKFEVTSLRALPQYDEIVDRMDVNREDLFGLDPKDYVGMVHYDSVPLNGEPSDLTARFHIKKVGGDKITLEFEGISVM